MPSEFNYATVQLLKCLWSNEILKDKRTYCNAAIAQSKPKKEDGKFLNVQEFDQKYDIRVGFFFFRVFWMY